MSPATGILQSKKQNIRPRASFYSWKGHKKRDNPAMKVISKLAVRYNTVHRIISNDEIWGFDAFRGSFPALKFNDC